MSNGESSKDPAKEEGGEGAPAPTPNRFAMIMEIFGLSRTATISAVAFVSAVILVALFLFVYSAPPRTIIITAGPADSMFATNAFKYAALLAKHDIKLKILTSLGSQENLQRLSDPSSKVDVGMVQGGITNAAVDKLVSLGSISYQPLLVFYRGEPLELLSGLAGKRVSIGPVGSGTHSLALTLLDINGIKPGGGTTLLDSQAKDASKELLAETLDALFVMGEDASPALMRDLLHAPDIHLFSFKQAAAYTRRIPYLNVLTLPEGIIDFGKNIPSRDIYLLGPTVELIARPHLHPALSDLLLEAAREVHGKASVLQRKGEFPAPLEHDFKISPDAARYYKSGRSFFYRYLPFWLASLTSRIVVLFVPMIVVFIPILRSVPPIYRWRMRARIIRWYRALLALEKDLFAGITPANRDRFMKRLDHIEDAVNKLKVPASFADQFYSLREHIAFVRGLVDERGRGSGGAGERESVRA
jgi:hypothetical protein